MSALPPMEPLEWQQMPLTGRVLIEASAGTGKTYNIGLIYLRLLLERGLRVEQILVTTFTDAAAQELRERLRKRLVEAERWLRQADPTTSDGDSLEAWLAANFTDNKPAALRQVQIARLDFDRAPIATIHGLCQRIQRDYPLESGTPFVAAEMLDDKSLLRECLEDFWRLRYLSGEIDPRESSLLVAGPEGLMQDLGSLFAGDAVAIPADGHAHLERLLDELRRPENIVELRRLGADKKLYAPRRTALATRLLVIADVLERGENVVVSLKQKLDNTFNVDKLEEQQSKDAAQRIGDHALIVSLQHVRGLLQAHVNFARGAVLAAALAYCREQLPRRAQQRDVQTFSMLIDSVHSRLCGVGASATLAGCLFEAFPAALIDEFQDTDQRQFEIFDRIYRDGPGESRGTLVMIGDPKQAIFGFRGGDIAAYQRASASVTQRFSLATNHRSSSALVGTMNAFYALTEGGFDDARILYRAVRASSKSDAKPYTVAGVQVVAPMVIHRFRNETDAQVKAVGELEKMALTDCANRIVELLNDPVRMIDSKRISPGDIAVLVATNNQLAELRSLLAARNVPCVGSGRASVFDGEIARDLELILYGVLNADDDRAVRGALSTRLLGASFADLLSWQDDTQAFECELERFANWRELVRNRGVLALVEALVALRGAQILAGQEGERRISDLRHLGELLAGEEAARHGLEGLYAWFAAMRRDDAADDGGDAAQARQLRVESDSQRVQLLTLHASKGLEFPIVFMPLAWRVSDRNGQRAPNVLRFHDQDGQACVDLGSANFVANRARHFREDLRERLRLLYVGLTRAKHALHVYWLDSAKDPQSDDEIWQKPALGLLLGQAQQRIGVTPDEAALDQLLATLQSIAVEEAFVGAVVGYVPPVQTSCLLAAREPLPGLRAFQWLHSFSSLTRQQQTSVRESGTADEAEAEIAANGDGNEPQTTIDETEDPRLRVLYALRGPRFGDAVHNVLEHAQPGRVWPEQRAMLATHLAAQAVRAGEELSSDPVELVGRLVDRVRAADLGDGLSLSGLAADSRVMEFEFQFPVQHVSIARLRALCAQHGCAGVVPTSLRATTLNGMLTGFVDLIFFHAGRFHVLDYKTNWLGARLSDYAPIALDAAMREHHYDLQALLYTVALHRYLGQRMAAYAPERHLGGSWYLFLRAVGLQSGLGVWRRVWPPALIRALDDAFAGVDEVAA